MSSTVPILQKLRNGDNLLWVTNASGTQTQVSLIPMPVLFLL